MRKRNFGFCLDKLLWWLLFLLPLILLVVYWAKTGTVSLSGAMTSAGLGILEASDIFVSLNSIFGVSGLVPLFASSDVLFYVCYIVCVYLLHLLVDFLLFIPRIADKWLNSLYGGDK